MIDFYFVSDEGGEGEKFKQSGLLSLGFFRLRRAQVMLIKYFIQKKNIRENMVTQRIISGKFN